MASTYVNDLRLNEMATGDQSGSWGTVTNTNLELIAEAFSFGTEGITTNADTHTTTIADGATDPGRSMFLKYTGTLDSACTITIAPNTISKLWFIENGTSGSQNIIIKQGSGATITIPPGDTKAIYSDGAGSGAAMVDAFASLSVVDLNVSGNLDVDGTANLDAVDIDGAVQIDNTVSVGVDDTGYDVKFFGDTASAFMLWDASADDLILGGAAGLSVNSAALVTGVLTTTAATVFNGGFAANDGSTISTADNTTQLTLISTDADANAAPTLDLYRNSGSPADEDLVGQTRFVGRNDNSQDVNYAIIKTKMLDVSDGTEDGRFEIETISAGGGLNRLTIDPTELIINDGSADLDFRVESDAETHMLFVDASTNRIGVMYNSPAANGIHVRPSGEAQIFIGSANAGGATLILDGDANGDGSGGDYAYIKHDTSGNLTIENLAPSGTEIAVNDNGGNIDFRVESDGNANMLFVDAGSDHVNIGTAGDYGSTLNVFKTGGSATVLNVVNDDGSANAGPFLTIDRRPSSPADGDFCGVIQFNGNSDAANTMLATINTRFDDVTNGSEDTSLFFKIRQAGGQPNVCHFHPTETVLNEDSFDRNFRVESDGNANMLFVNAGTEHSKYWRNCGRY